MRAHSAAPVMPLTGRDRIDGGVESIHLRAVAS